MNPFTQRLAAFVLCIGVGCGLSITLTKVAGPAMIIPATPLVQGGEIQEITMEVSYGWCSGEACPDYKIIFQRQGRKVYYSPVTRVGPRSWEVNQGELLKTDFDLLAQVIESQSFFESNSNYPADTWCTDCVITKVSVLKDGRRKKVVSLNAEISLQLWTIQRTLEGVAERVQWLKE